MIRLTVWGENHHEQHDQIVRDIYPDGMHTTIARAVEADGDIVARTATLDQPDHGLTDEVLNETDVLAWWGHVRHGDVADDVVERVHKRVLEGMGLLALHSAHFSKIFIRLMGTACSLTWRSEGETERVWVCNPGHPIARGVPPYFELEREEMYGEPYAVPDPDETVFVSWFEGGEVFRSGLCYHRGAGRIFYFRPGDQEFPTYHDAHVQRVIRNATRWLAPQGDRWAEEVVNVTLDKAPQPFTPRGKGMKP